MSNAIEDSQSINQLPYCHALHSDALLTFGLADQDLDHYMYNFLPASMLNRLPLTADQIDKFADILDWDILSTRELPGWLFVKYADRINWFVFLTNGKPKEILYLLDVKHKLEECRHIFFDSRIKKLYYNKQFMLVFPEYVDFDWCARNMHLDAFVIESNWHKFNVHVLCKYQHLPASVLLSKKMQIRWDTASKFKQSEDVLEQLVDVLNWTVVCKRQTLSVEFIKKHISRVDFRMISRYQKLTDEFIIKYANRLDMKYVSKYQLMTIDTIHCLADRLDFELLSANARLIDMGIFVVKAHSKWFVIEPPILDGFEKINFVSTSIMV